MDGLSTLHGLELTNDNRVYLLDHASGGVNYYIVMVNGKKFDDFFSTKMLTWSQQWDIAEGYKEALDAYRPGMVE